jgi:ERO1-like protein alpha
MERRLSLSACSPRRRWRSLAAAAATTMMLAVSASPVSAADSSSSPLQPPPQLFARDMVDFLQYQVCSTPALSGSVQDAGCSFEAVDKAVAEHFHPLLMELSRLSFFRHFKVDLGRQCPFWPDDDGMCASIDCAVCECPADQIPATWYQMDQLQAREAAVVDDDAVVGSGGQPCSDQTGEGELSRVDRTNADVGDRGGNSDSADESSMVYINLLENPERYTGYSGLQAERIWRAIYEENCFTPPDEASVTGMCLEERVYYRLISGLQASINTHIALRYKFPSGRWDVNPALFVFRVGRHRDRLQNLYFTYLFVMRAIGRYSHELLQYDYATGNDAEDQRVRDILRVLLLEDQTAAASSSSSPSEAGAASCPTELTSVLSGFDESALFRVDSDAALSGDAFRDAVQQKHELEVQFRAKFQNVSRIMDCVTCEKCRLWGKLQTMGLGAAIKILLTDDAAQLPVLPRNELIALINVANNLARSVDGVKMMRQLEFVSVVQQFAAVCGGAAFVVGLLILCVRRRARRRLASSKHAKKE